MIVKPQQWAFSPGLIAPEWRWFHRDALSILPLWDASIGTSDPYDIARKLFAQLTIDAINHTTWTETEFGRAVFSTHRNNSPTPGTLADGLDFSSNPISVSAGSDFTFIFHGIIDSIFGNNGGFWRSGSSNFGPNFNIFNASQRRPWVRWNGIDILKITSGQDFNLGTVVSLVFRIKSGASVDFWVDGIEKHSATHTQSTPSFSIYHVGLQASGSEAVYCKYAMLGFWSRAWSDNEIVVWSRNPFGPFRMADDPPIWQVAAAGGGTVIVGLANELDTAFAITRSKQSQLALAQETDIGLGVSAQHRLQLGLASESGIAFAVSPQRKFAVAQALEVDTAFSVSRQKDRSVGLASETDIALRLLGFGTISVGLALETDIGLAVAAQKAQGLGLAAEADTAQNVTVKFLWRGEVGGVGSWTKQAGLAGSWTAESPVGTTWTKEDEL